MRNAWILFIFFVFSMAFFPQQIFAHAVLIDADPAADSKLIEGPEKVTLTFNEEIKANLFSVTLMNQSRENVETPGAERSEDGQKLMLKLPELADGAYLLSYNVVSADGHPVKGSYVFLVGEASSALDVEWESSQFQSMDAVIFLIRAVYYLALLWVTGWVFWGLFYSNVYQSDRMRNKYKFTSLILQQIHLLSLIVLIVTQWLFNSTSSGIPLATSFGLSWIGSLALSLVGFFVLHRSKWMDGIWIFLMFIAKVFNGHSNAFEPVWVSLSSNFLHLLPAAIWAGGLLYIAVFWRKYRLQVRDFIQVFTKFAMLSILMLLLTGTLTTVIFLPEVDYLWVTPWGKVLILKIVLVLFVLFVAGRIHSTLKKKPLHEAWNWIKTDVCLMLLIIISVGALSYLSPVPKNQPLEWNIQDETVNMNLSISPKTPGKNTFQIQSGNEQVGRVELMLYAQDREEIPPIVVPLKPTETRGHFSAEGYYLPFHGEWRAEVRVIDELGEEYFYNKSFRVFDTGENQD